MIDMRHHGERRCVHCGSVFPSITHIPDGFTILCGPCGSLFIEWVNPTRYGDYLIPEWLHVVIYRVWPLFGGESAERLANYKRFDRFTHALSRCEQSRELALEDPVAAWRMFEVVE